MKKGNMNFYLLISLILFVMPAILINGAVGSDYASDSPQQDAANQNVNFDEWTEKKLIRELLENYDKRARPVADGLSPFGHIKNKADVQQIAITFNISLIQILQLNENEQVLTTNLRNMYNWTDFHLRWKPENYGNITYINIPSSEIWLPDIALYNSADERLQALRPCDARITSDGEVSWQPMSITKSTCPVHIKYFPFDQQLCHMKFGPWTYDSSRLLLIDNPHMDLYKKDYENSPEWDLIKTYAGKFSFSYTCCTELYEDIKFYISIKRHAQFYSYVLILPCFLLSSLTLVLFWLPPETPAKMILGMNIFVAFFLLLLLLVEAIPNASSSFPLIGNYYCMNMALVTLSTFLCLVIVNFHFRGDMRLQVPYWLRVLVLEYGARYLLVNVGMPKNPNPKPATKPFDIAASALSRTDSTILRASAAHYQFKMNNLSSLGKNMPNESESSKHGQYSKQRPMSNEKTSDPLKDIYLLTQNSETINALIQSGFTEEQICQLQNMYLFHRQQKAATSKELTSNSPLLSTSHDCQSSEDESKVYDGDSDSEEFCPACADLAVMSNRIQSAQKLIQQNELDPGADLAAIWAAAASVQNGQLSGSAARRPMSSQRHHQQYCMSEDDSSVCCPPASRQPKASNDMSVGFDAFLVECLKHHSNGNNSTDKFSESNKYKSIDGRQHNSRTWSPVSDAKVARRVNTVIRDVSEIVKGIRFLQKMNENNEQVAKIIAEWRAVGMVMDRLFFLSYILALIVGIILFFPRSDTQLDS